MNALEVKQKLANYHLIDLHRLAVFTEASMYSNADVISVTSAWYVQEFEIKLTRADLLSEIGMITMAREWIENKPPSGKKITSFTKLTKHRHYMALDNPAIAVPNEFSFFIPSELEDVALKGVAGTPYGVCLIDKEIHRENSWGHKWSYMDSFHWSKKPRKLHRERLSEENKKKVMRRVTMEAFGLREKLINERSKS